MSRRPRARASRSRKREVAKVEALIRQIIPASDLDVILSNIGVTPGFSSIYTSNSAQHTAFVQVGLKDDHKVGSYEYMARVKQRIAEEMPELSSYFQSGGMVDAVLNLGLPAPIDVQVAGSNLARSHETALKLASEIQRIPGVADVYIPQDVDYPALKLDVDRTRASELGLDQQEVVGNVITALTSNQMIAPSYWVDPKSGQDYMLTVQYTEGQVKSLSDLRAISLRASGSLLPTRLDTISSIKRVQAPTEVDHYAIRRVTDVYVRPLGEELGAIADRIDQIIAQTKIPEGLNVTLRGMVQGMRASFRSFAIGLTLSVVLLYLILVAQFRSFVDPLLILLAVPPGLTGVLLTLYLTGTTLNVMSLMGVVMLTGIAVSNSILIVEFTRQLREEGMERARRGGHGLPRSSAAGSDDLAGDHHRSAADGAQAGRGQRKLRAAGSRASGRINGLRHRDRVPGAGRLPAGLRKEGSQLVMRFVRNSSRCGTVVRTAADGADAGGCREAGDPEQSPVRGGAAERASILPGPPRSSRRDLADGQWRGHRSRRRFGEPPGRRRTSTIPWSTIVSARVCWSINSSRISEERAT